MKKNLLSILTLLTISTTAFGEFVLAPQWSEFCPTSYLNANPSKLSKDTNYWYERRVQFENVLLQCKSLQGEDLKSCYEQVRASEINKNKSWEAKMQAEYAASQRNQEYLQRSQQYNLLRDVTKMLTQ